MWAVDGVTSGGTDGALAYLLLVIKSRVLRSWLSILIATMHGWRWGVRPLVRRSDEADTLGRPAPSPSPLPRRALVQRCKCALATHCCRYTQKGSVCRDVLLGTQAHAGSSSRQHFR
ncbi:hypothetical protein K458DRAFT_10709 [Lentithecium fluviatile CBS 122367]|uniref:Uncharacterized protein n=1 Tax=Lentithecium fluviatile CBS 122367 TaxID=1168545 RepID=A0A6G1JPJ7_9PLEO|nr:hypothetical protein K458DRAFT_10709 [Lentithecium fluviatile CBS 122367]